MAGRPTSLTPEVQAVIVASVLAGNYRATAAQAAGICERTLRSWVSRGDEGEEPFAAFSAALKKAEAEAEVQLLAEVRAGGEDWQSKAWILERSRPQRWSQRVRTQVTEEVSLFVSKLREQPDLQRKVADVLAEGISAPSTNAH